MIEFLKWWYTNSEGREYMTFMGCSLQDTPVIIITCLLCAAIVIIYMLISYEANKHAHKYPDSITKKYLNQLHKVFAFCAFTGYGYIILSAFINPYKLRILLLSILIVWSIKFLKSIKKSNVIDRIYQGEALMKEKYENYKMLSTKFTNEDANGFITMESLAIVPYEIWSEWINGVRYRRIKHPEKEVYFITEMDPEKTKDKLAVFATQWHNCIEEVKVVKGHLIDLSQDSKIYTKGEIVRYDYMKRHKPASKVFAVYEVEFKY